MLNKQFINGQMFLAASSIPDRVTKSITSLEAPFSTIGKTLAVLMIIILGIAWISGRQGAAWAKGQLGRVVCGVAVIVLAVDLVAWVTGVFGG